MASARWERAPTRVHEQVVAASLAERAALIAAIITTL